MIVATMILSQLILWLILVYWMVDHVRTGRMPWDGTIWRRTLVVRRKRP